jgi:predicted enzyme related to lactoylglutathione lyase
MFKDSKACSSFSTNDMEKAKQFYDEKLGIATEETHQGLKLSVGGGKGVFIYPKDNHEAASFTVLNFIVDDIDEAVDALVATGVEIEKYEGAHQDEKGIARGIAAKMGPDIAWFKDPAGNILSVQQGG